MYSILVFLPANKKILSYSVNKRDLSKFLCATKEVTSRQQSIHNRRRSINVNYVASCLLPNKWPSVFGSLTQYFGRKEKSK
jgi:hypothetical protein